MITLTTKQWRIYLCWKRGIYANFFFLSQFLTMNKVAFSVRYPSLEWMKKKNHKSSLFDPQILCLACVYVCEMEGKEAIHKYLTWHDIEEDEQEKKKRNIKNAYLRLFWWTIEIVCRYTCLHLWGVNTEWVDGDCKVGTCCICCDIWQV